MLATIICLSSIPLIIWSYVLSLKRNSLAFEMKTGWICHCCRDGLDMTDEEKLKKLFSRPKSYHVCISCLRERKLKMLKNPLLKWKYKFWDRFIMVSEPYTRIYLILVFSLIALDLIFIFTGVKFRLALAYGTTNLIYWILTLYKVYYVSIKKPSE